jgi:hypothetical protein
MTTPISTTTTIDSYPKTTYVDGVLTLSAFVTPSTFGVCTGTVTFSKSSTKIAVVPLVDNAARLTIDLASYTAGSADFTAAYSGDSKYGSSSGSKSVTVTAISTTAGSWQANSSTSGAFDYTLQLNQLQNIAAALDVIAVNSSEIRNYIGDISKSMSAVTTIATLANSTGIHTAGGYDWLGALSLVNYFVQQGNILNTGDNVASDKQKTAASALQAFNNNVINDTAAALASTVLTKGQAGYATDTKVIKYGDGTTAWSSLPSADPADLTNYKFF